MNKIDLKLPNNEKIEVKIYRKRMKNVRLKVYFNGEIALSVPYGTSDKWIRQFLQEKAEWIQKKAISERTNGIEPIVNIENGMSHPVFGKRHIIEIWESNTKRVYNEGEKVVIYTRDINNKKVIAKQLDKWLRDELFKRVQIKIDKYYPVFKKHGVKRPNVNIRKMKTMWGNCKYTKGQITLNLYLYQTSESFLEYVVFHEMVHLIHNGHSKAFYDFLSMYMPDWEQRKDEY